MNIDHVPFFKTYPVLGKRYNWVNQFTKELIELQNYVLDYSMGNIVPQKKKEIKISLPK